ncbi:hypothetical protein [Pontibacillus sp. HMF3514]|uniref:hypothetical protein n=1 Tax=Pontibacillus sp. HMF3514 TaxID=2692425 RepID=UPI00131F7EA5|nr:hypothetical protein [Pontibacillus sp. HMF3514]QHE52831.1 hypothetical protein GS400_12720 [Pontibacillus sp. HMF3514]
MKKIICLILILLLITGCSQETTTNEKDITKIHNGDVKVYEDVLTLEDVEEDIDGDGHKERIILNVSPAPHPNPESDSQYLWDDSHVWQLVVKNDGNQYTLFDDHVQGKAELYIVNEKKDQNAIVFQQKGTMLHMSVFRYKDDYFEKEVVYNSGMMLHRSTIK